MCTAVSAASECARYHATTVNIYRRTYALASVTDAEWHHDAPPQRRTGLVFPERGRLPAPRPLSRGMALSGAATALVLLAAGLPAACAAPPPPTLPFWSAAVPRPGAGPLGGLAPQAEHVVVHRATRAHGTYNHGAQIFVHPGGNWARWCTHNTATVLQSDSYTQLPAFKSDDAATMLRASLRLRHSLRQPDPTAINVRDYGANGTGQCLYGEAKVSQPYGQCTGENDDRAAIQAAVDAAVAEHRPLFFPAGVYVVSAPIVVNTSDILIFGNFWMDTVLAAGPGCQGAEAVLLFPTLTFPHSFSLIEVKGLSVNANSIASNAIQALSITRSRFSGIGVFRASNAGLRLACGWELHVEDSIIGCAGGGNGVGLLATGAINGLSVLTSTFEGE